MHAAVRRPIACLLKLTSALSLQSEVDNDAIGRVICNKAAELNSAAVVLAKHRRGRLKEMLMGSVCKYCVQHCTSPVVVVH